MARYTYNQTLVNEALQSLNDSAAAIVNTNNSVTSGINMICNARGAENLVLDESFKYIKGLQKQVTDSIDAISTEIRSKQQQISDYENAPWYKKVFATGMMGVLKIFEGIGSFGETIVDGLVSIVGFIGGIFSSRFQDCIAEFVKTDYVGDFFSEEYEEGGLVWLNQYSVMSHESTAANILKGVGFAVPAIVVGVVTGGAGTAVSLGVSAATVGVSGIGSGTQAGLQAGKTFNQAFGQGIKEGAIAAGTTLAIGGIANKLTSAGRASSVLNSNGALDDVASGIDDAISSTKSTAQTLQGQLASITDDTLKTLGDDVLTKVNAMDDYLNIRIGQNNQVIGSAADAIGAAKGTISQADDVFKAAKALQSAAKSAGHTELVGTLDDIIATAGNASKSGKDAIKILTAAKGTSAFAKVEGKGTISKAVSKVSEKVGGKITIGEKAGKIITSAKGKVAKIPVVGKTATKVSGAVKNVAGKATQGITSFATAHPVAAVRIASGVATGVGIAATSPIDSAKATTEYRQLVNQKPTAGEQLANNTNTPPSPNVTDEYANTTTTPSTTTPETGVQNENTPAGTPSSGGSNISYREEVTPGNSSDQFGNQSSTPDTPQEETPNTSTGTEIPKEEVTPGDTNSTPSTGDIPKEEVTPNDQVEIPPYEDIPQEEVTPGDQIDIPSFEDTPTETPSTGDGTTDNYYSPSENDGYTGGYTGGGYNGGYSDGYTGGYTNDTTSAENAALEHMVPEEMETETELETPLEESSDSLAGLVGGNDYVNIPTAQTPITADPTTTQKKSSIPVIAGLSAAAVGGIGTKAFLDRKENSKNDDENEVESEEWDGESELDMNYDQISVEEKDYLDPTDEYAYQEGDEIVESYQAVNSSELESMQ